MHWKIEGKEGTKVSLPDQISAKRWYSGTINSKAVKFYWDKDHSHLFIKDPESPRLEKSVRIRRSNRAYFKEEGTYESEMEYGTGQMDEVGFASLTYEIDVPGGANRSSARASGKSVVRSPMAGKVLTVAVENDQEVQKGDLLMVIEAMKMENKIPAPTAGKVSGLKVNGDQQVGVGEELVTISPIE